ncbi:endonuclease III domain-containing protein [Candidatus Woesearchaeota archaeon]|nr:endonuclease III domain-containing protein [Candidatus Woesearchaeota archaeon]
MRMQTLFKMLLKNHHPQGWWPLAGKYHQRDYSYPRNQKQREDIIIGAILTQNTSWKNVEKALEQLRNNRLLSFSALLKCPKSTLATCIRSSGYFNQKAITLKEVASFFKRNPYFRMLSLEKQREKLLHVHGIGPETADSILLYAFRRPIFVVDAYTKRLFALHGFKEKTYDEIQQRCMRELPHDFKVYNEFHALIVAWGKTQRLNNRKGRKRV